MCCVCVCFVCCVCLCSSIVWMVCCVCLCSSIVWMVRSAAAVPDLRMWYFVYDDDDDDDDDDDLCLCILIIILNLDFVVRVNRRLARQVCTLDIAVALPTLTPTLSLHLPLADGSVICMFKRAPQRPETRADPRPHPHPYVDNDHTAHTTL